MLPYRVGIISSNNKTAELVASILNNKCGFTSYTLKNTPRKQIIKDIAAREKEAVAFVDIKRAEQFEFLDSIIYVPDFSDISDFGRNNPPRSFPTWNENLQEYNQTIEDDLMVINMNRNCLATKEGQLAKENHKTETLITKIIKLPTYVLFGQITDTKVIDVYHQISRRFTADVKIVKGLRK